MINPTESCTSDEFILEQPLADLGEGARVKRPVQQAEAIDEESRTRLLDKLRAMAGGGRAQDVLAFGQVAVGGNSGEGLRIPERVTANAARVDIEIGTIAPDEQGVTGKGRFLNDRGGLAAIAIERCVGPIGIAVERDGGVARPEAEKGY